MYTMLVCFTKYDNDDNIIDTQYHVFYNCKNRIDFIHDELFRAFSDKGYLWSAIHFNLDLAYRCDFTISKIGD